jgi:hypothetical protein
LQAVSAPVLRQLLRPPAKEQRMLRALVLQLSELGWRPSWQALADQRPPKMKKEHATDWSKARLTSKIIILGVLFISLVRAILDFGYGTSTLIDTLKEAALLCIFLLTILFLNLRFLRFLEKRSNRRSRPPM